MVEGSPKSLPHQTLSDNACKARYGVSYLESVCSAAGVPLTEPRPDTDVRAVDCMIAFPEGDVHVQVKCSQTTTPKQATSLRWPIDPGWAAKWSRFRSPVYLLVVRVRPVRPWIDHAADGTFHHAHAIWQRVDTSSLGTSIAVPLANRFSGATLSIWQRDLNAAYNQELTGNPS